LSIINSPNAGFPVPQRGLRGYQAALNQIFAMLDSTGAIPPLSVRPSAWDASFNPTGLGVTIAPGTFCNRSADQAVVYGGGTVTVPASATTYLWLTAAGAPTSGTAWPTSGGDYVRLAVVTASATAITLIVDARIPFRAIAPGP
jgi:hypothetical protein